MISQLINGWLESISTTKRSLSEKDIELIDKLLVEAQKDSDKNKKLQALANELVTYYTSSSEVNDLFRQIYTNQVIFGTNNVQLGTPTLQRREGSGDMYVHPVALSSEHGFSYGENDEE